MSGLYCHKGGKIIIKGSLNNPLESMCLRTGVRNLMNQITHPHGVFNREDKTQSLSAYRSPLQMASIISVKIS